MARDKRRSKHKKQKKGGSSSSGGQPSIKDKHAAIRKSACKLAGRNIGKSRISQQVQRLATSHGLSVDQVRKVFDPAFRKAGGRL